MFEDESVSPVVVIAEDEQELADLYKVWLSEDFEVWTAYGGQEALDLIDETVDVVLLDRRMPDTSGDEVLAQLRARGFDGPVAMVSAVDPDIDLLEMDCTEYVSKPVRKEELQALAGRLETVAALGADIQEFYGLAAKKEAMHSSVTSRDLEDVDAYAELESRLTILRERIDLEERVPKELKATLNGF